MAKGDQTVVTVVFLAKVLVDTETRAVAPGRQAGEIDVKKSHQQAAHY